MMKRTLLAMAAIASLGSPAMASVRYTANVDYDAFSETPYQIVYTSPGFIIDEVYVRPDSCIGSTVCDGLMLYITPVINVNFGGGTPDRYFAYFGFESDQTFGAFTFDLGTLSRTGVFEGASPGHGNQGSLTIEQITDSLPEPATWGMMVLGMGAIGFAMRRHPPVRGNALAHP